MIYPRSHIWKVQALRLEGEYLWFPGESFLHLSMLPSFWCSRICNIFKSDISYWEEGLSSRQGQHPKTSSEDTQRFLELELGMGIV